MNYESNHYEAPVLTVSDIEVEKGFALSDADFSIPDFEDGGTF